MYLVKTQSPGLASPRKGGRVAAATNSLFQTGARKMAEYKKNVRHMGAGRMRKFTVMLVLALALFAARQATAVEVELLVQKDPLNPQRAELALDLIDGARGEALDAEENCDDAVAGLMGSPVLPGCQTAHQAACQSFAQAADFEALSARFLGETCYYLKTVARLNATHPEAIRATYKANERFGLALHCSGVAKNIAANGQYAAYKARLDHVTARAWCSVVRADESTRNIPGWVAAGPQPEPPKDPVGYVEPMW
jgi:hypothetical protein